MNIKLALTLRFLALVTLLMASFSFIIYENYVRYRDKDYEERLVERTGNIANLLLSVSDKDSITDLLTSNNNYRLMTSHRISIFDEQFQLVSTEDRAANITDSSMLSSLKKGMDISYAVGDTHYVGLQLTYKDEPYLVVASAVDIIGRRNSEFLGQLIFIAFIVGLVATSIMGWFFSSQALQPIKHVIGEVDKITANNLSTRLQIPKSEDEIAQLNSTFNKMLDRLEASFVMQRNFVSNASHEFRTPITAIKAQIEVMLMQERSKEEYITTLNSIHEDIDRFMQLMQSLSELAKANIEGSENNSSRVPIIEVIAEARAELMRSKPRYRINLNIENLPEYELENYVPGNEALLKSAVKNVIENACKFSQDQRCDVSVWFDATKTYIKVVDEGIGISPDELPHIFEPFYRANDTRGISGHGIGLSLVKKIIDLHGGTIEVTSIQSKGSQFILSLPHLIYDPMVS